MNIHFLIQTEVRAQDSVFVIVSVAINPKGRDMCWEFFKTNSAKLLAQYEVCLIDAIDDLLSGSPAELTTSRLFSSI